MYLSQVARIVYCIFGLSQMYLGHLLYLSQLYLSHGHAEPMNYFKRSENNPIVFLKAIDGGLESIQRPENL